MPSHSHSHSLEYHDIAAAAAAGSISKQEAGERLLRLHPGHGMGYLYLAAAKEQTGDMEETERLLWRAIEGMPCDYSPYLSCSEMLLRRNPSDPVGHRLKAMALWKLSLVHEIPPPIAAVFAADRHGKGDPEDPSTYAAWAQSYEDKYLSSDPVADERVLPFQFLTDLQRQAAGTISRELLQKILDNPARCAPVWLAALREVLIDPHAHVISPDALDYVIALLGEQGGPQVLPDLLPDSQSADTRRFLHMQWAIWRIGQRFPAETLAAFRAATAGADLEVRHTIADQILLMPETPGRKSALVDLLEGFSGFATRVDAPLLLITVTQGLADMSYDHEATRLRKLYTPLLTDSGREEVREIVRNPELFEPTPIYYGIPDTNIDAICLEAALKIDESEDDADEENGEEEEDEEPPRVKPDRNGPCWCGSGKKYKKCHLQSDEEAERSGPTGGEKSASISQFETMQQRLLDSIGEVRSRSELREAHLRFFDKPPENFDPDDPRAESFYEWAMLDFRPGGTGRTVLEEYLRRRPRLPDSERAVLESWRAARFGLFETEHIEHGKGLQLRDVFAGERVFISDSDSARSGHRGEYVLARVMQLETGSIFTCSGLAVIPTMLPKLAARIEEEGRKAGQSAADFVRSNAHRIHRFLDEIARAERRQARTSTAEGDTIEFSSAAYRVNDEESLADALRSVDVFEDTTPQQAAPDRRTFAWFETGAADGPRRTFGRIEIHNGHLLLECNSRRRLSIGRQLLEKHAAQFLTHEGDSFRQPGG